jgi:cytochrome c556
MKRIVILLLGVAIPTISLLAQTRVPRTVKRAQPPAKLKSDVFYSDAFKEGLVGERPADLGKAVVASGANQSSAPPTGSGTDSADGGAAGNGWSSVISPTTIEDNIKGLKQQVDKEVTTLSDFKGKGHKLARRDYTLLATLFGIAAEYDGDVRWKKDAAVARDAFARSAANFKVATDQAFNEAKARKQELADLVGGSSPFGGKTADVKTAWPQVADRASLMQYLDAAWQQRLNPALSDKGAFTSGADKILRDAEMFAAIGDVLAKEGMKDAADTEYVAFCKKLRDGARQIISATKQKDFGEAAKAKGTISKACDECHESYRS